MYDILPYTIKKAKTIKVQIKPSTHKNKKIDVFKNGVLIYSIGDNRFSDYPHLLKTHGKEYADKRRALYHLRHKKDISILGSKGWLSSFLIW